MKEIQLSQNKVAIVDDEDFERVNQFKWTYLQNPRSLNEYARRTVRSEGKQHSIYLHRFILSAPPDKQVDHRNNDGLDCRRQNLRLCDCRQNHHNMKVRRDSASQYKGVRFESRYEKWGVKIFFKGKRIFLGYFDNEVDAAKAYDNAAIKYFGEFARLNFYGEGGSTNLETGAD